MQKINTKNYQDINNIAQEHEQILRLIFLVGNGEALQKQIKEIVLNYNFHRFYKKSFIPYDTYNFDTGILDLLECGLITHKKFQNTNNKVLTLTKAGLDSLNLPSDRARPLRQTGRDLRLIKTIYRTEYIKNILEANKENIIMMNPQTKIKQIKDKYFYFNTFLFDLKHTTVVIRRLLIELVKYKDYKNILYKNGKLDNEVWNTYYDENERQFQIISTSSKMEKRPDKLEVELLSDEYPTLLRLAKRNIYITDFYISENEDIYIQFLLNDVNTDYNIKTIIRQITSVLSAVNYLFKDLIKSDYNKLEVSFLTLVKDKEKENLFFNQLYRTQKNGNKFIDNELMKQQKGLTNIYFSVDFYAIDFYHKFTNNKRIVNLEHFNAKKTAQRRKLEADIYDLPFNIIDIYDKNNITIKYDKKDQETDLLTIELLRNSYYKAHEIDEQTFNKIFTYITSLKERLEESNKIMFSTDPQTVDFKKYAEFRQKALSIQEPEDFEDYGDYEEDEEPEEPKKASETLKYLKELKNSDTLTVLNLAPEEDDI